jgi:hypothetical protein
VLSLPPVRNENDWEILLRELRELKLLDHVNFTIHCAFSWYEDLQTPVPTFTTPCGRAYVPVVKSNTVRFEGTNLSKGDGLDDFKGIISHMDEVHRQISSRRNGWPSGRVDGVETPAAE